MYFEIVLLQYIIVIAIQTMSNARRQEFTDGRPGVGVTKPISPVPLFSSFFQFVKTYVNCWISRLYLTGGAAALLRWHLSNIKVIQII